jgi:biopolymer transport protein ExbD
MKRTARIFVTAAGILCFASTTMLYQGCSSSRSFPNNTVQIAVSADQKITVEGKAVDAAKLPNRLKSMGVTSDTVIRVLIQQNTSPDLMREITRSLGSAGFRRVLFTQPKHIEITRKDTEAKQGSQR